MKANYETPKNSATELTGGTLYEANKQIMANEPPMNISDIVIAKDELLNYLQEESNVKYFMLLNNELHDYTVFNIDRTSNNESDVVDILVDECLMNRGTLLSIEEDATTRAYEIWIKNEENEAYVYYFFPYDEGVIEI